MLILVIFSCLTSGAFAQYQSLASSCSKASSRVSASTYTKPPLVTKGHCPVIATDPIDFNRSGLKPFRFRSMLEYDTKSNAALISTTVWINVKKCSGVNQLTMFHES
ncbi:hypothetical protein KQX54_015106 [Cotesia glomerata]|uniref:Uncharacterized protein n=1 Tax=Cotesia glomerata TaxID=32391 RepID=A0AAV7IQZ4_COTGL|nr:hypothetical protein KQX54_015106 [Cotesia glomerata]